jgi:CubicO group peptidase (beta-lactamase class C family)
MARPTFLLLLLAACGGRSSDQPLPRPDADPLAAALAAGEFPRTTSALARQHGATVVEAYAGGADVSTLHDVRSVTKTFGALAVGLAIADGAIASVDAPAFAFLDHLRPFAHDEPAKAEITIADLLTMSSALDCDDDDPASPGNEEGMYPQRSWQRWAVDLPLRAPPYDWSYCSAGSFLLGRIVERATGEPVDRYLERRLLAPLGVEQVEWNRSPAGEVATSGQLRIRTRDLAAVAQLLLERGGTIVPAAWIDEMTTVHRRPNASADPRGELGYGYLIWQRTYRTPCGPQPGWYMSGNGGNHAVVLPGLDAVAVVTTVNFNTRGMHDQTTRLLEEQVLPRLECVSR